MIVKHPKFGFEYICYPKHQRLLCDGAWYLICYCKKCVEAEQDYIKKYNEARAKAPAELSNQIEGKNE